MAIFYCSIVVLVANSLFFSYDIMEDIYSRWEVYVARGWEKRPKHCGCALEVVVNGGCPSVQLLAINLSPVNFTYKTPLIQESGVVNMYVEFEEAILNPDVSCDAVEVLVSFFYSNR
ncbi:uncharacterized protein LOC110940126 isoform X2 [Helianthus annuus]|uniref:uncharacterized protein LOC110940126 isoform X2 n=1 Tax=Helianthus annuus TaxID=4232 RepID=UPI001652DEA1|nr:uncharacterized protein LOC110940126 isoform X2 [Helianthus annuus]